MAGGVGLGTVGAGLLAVPEPTMVTKAAGWGAIGLASDLVTAGVLQMGTSQTTQSFTAQGVSAGAQALGVNPANAYFAGETAEMALAMGPLAVVGKVGAFSATAGKPAVKSLSNPAVQTIENFLGGAGIIKRNVSGDVILMRGDKEIRFDIINPHGDQPHFHLEKQMPSGRWKDAGSEHRYYFKQD